MERYTIIEKNTGSLIVVHPKMGDYPSIVTRWGEAHKKDVTFSVADTKGNLHRVNSRRVIDIFEGTLDEPKEEKKEEKEELNLDQS